MKSTKVLSFLVAATALVATSEARADYSYFLENVASKSIYVQNAPVNGFYPGSAPTHFLQVQFTLANGDIWQVDGDPTQLDPMSLLQLELATTTTNWNTAAVIFDCPTPTITFQTTESGYESCSNHYCTWVSTAPKTINYVMIHLGSTNEGGLPACRINQFNN